MPEIPDLSYAMNLPPEQALAYFRGKKELKTAWHWQEVWQEEHAKIFTVAKAMRADILQDIRGALEKAMAEGRTFEQFKKELEPVLKAKGWWGKQFVVDKDGKAKSVQLGSPWRLKTIYRTNLQTSYMAGRYREQMDQVEERPYWQYVAVRDARTRPAHLAMDGRIFRWDDPVWKTIYPPNDWNCRCRVRALNDRGLARSGGTVESSGGNLSRPVQLNPATKEFMPHTVYKIPGSKETFSPGWGWDYNPGKSAWLPSYDKYSYEIARQAVLPGLNGPDFELFYNVSLQAQKAKLAGATERIYQANFPVTVLSPADMEILGAKRQTVWLSAETFGTHLSKHPEITFHDYKNLPEILDGAKLIGHDPKRANRWVFITEADGHRYKVVLKTTKNEEVFIKTFHLFEDETKMKKFLDTHKIFRREIK